MVNPNQSWIGRREPDTAVEKARVEIADRVARWLGVPASDVVVTVEAGPDGTRLTGHWWPHSEVSR